MGASHSLSHEELLDLKQNCQLDEASLKKLLKTFRQLDADKSGSISLEEFLAIPDLKDNPLVERVVSVFDSDKSGAVDFKEFVLWLSKFTGVDLHKERLEFLFQIYDVNSDGYISNGDLFRALKQMVGDNLQDVQLQQLVDRTILQGDKDRDGRLSFEEFCELIKKSDVDSKLMISL